VIIVDSSVIVAYMNATDDHHEVVSAWLEASDDDLATTPLIVAEVDRLVAARGGRMALSALRADLAAGAYLVEWWPSAITSTVNVAERYADNELGLADASLVALAERHFRAVRPLTASKAFRLLPMDS
jgi:predicted nucleic acid-binding protein